MFLKSYHWLSRVAMVFHLFSTVMEKFSRVEQAKILVLVWRISDSNSSVAFYICLWAVSTEAVRIIPTV